MARVNFSMIILLNCGCDCVSDTVASQQSQRHNLSRTVFDNLRNDQNFGRFLPKIFELWI